MDLGSYCRTILGCKSRVAESSGPVKRTSNFFVQTCWGLIFSIASWQANGCTHDTTKKTLEMILQEKIGPLCDLFVLSSRSGFVVLQKMIMLEGN